MTADDRKLIRQARLVAENREATKDELKSARDRVREAIRGYSEPIYAEIQALRPIGGRAKFSAKGRKITRGVLVDTPLGRFRFAKGRLPNAKQRDRWERVAPIRQKLNLVEGALTHRLRESQYRPVEPDPEKPWQWSPDRWPGGKDKWRRAIEEAANRREIRGYVTVEAEAVIRTLRDRIFAEALRRSADPA